MPVDELRRRTWEMLAAKKHSGAMPSLDNKSQAIFLLLTAGYKVKDVAVGLSVTENFVRVSKRNATKRMGLEPANIKTPKVQGVTAATNKHVDAAVDALCALPIEELARVAKKINAEIRAGMREVFTPEELRRLGIDVA